MCVVRIQRGSHILQDSSCYDGNYSDSQDSLILYTTLIQGRKVLFHFNQEELHFWYARADVVDMQELAQVGM
jgi:hypothetical protein